jgi:hypothetical protein
MDATSEAHRCAWVQILAGAYGLGVADIGQSATQTDSLFTVLPECSDYLGTTRQEIKMNRFQQGSLFKVKRKGCSDVWVFRWYGYSTEKKIYIKEMIVECSA